MSSNKLKELEATRARLAELEEAVATELRKELAGLPAKYGFGSVAAFISAVKKAAGGRRVGRKGGGRRKRSVITDEMRTQVKKLVEAGKTGSQIAREVGISLPSVQNIKKALGLVKKR